jgi:hypothetical protein
MTIHYHGTPITPRSELLKLSGRHFCVSFKNPRDIDVCHQIGQSVMLDNGAFSYWMAGNGEQPFGGYYSDDKNFRGYRGTELYFRYVEWCEKWCEYQTTWCIIPDAIDSGAEENERLMDLWPLKSISKRQAAPVWHLDESVDRLETLITNRGGWPRICIGSAGRFANVGDASWRRRIDHVFNRISNAYGRVPYLHMLRGMQLCRPEWGYPFASLDSTDVAQNHAVNGNIVARADGWDGSQCPPIWTPRMEQKELLDEPEVA